MRRALRIDERSLGLGHPSVARDLISLARLLEDQGRWPAAIALYARAKPIMTGTHGTTSTPGDASLSKAFLAQQRDNFRAYGQALHHADAGAATNRAESFELAQWALQNDAADALSSMSARFARGGQKLGELVREQQDLLDGREVAYRSLDTATGKADAKAAEAARAMIAGIEAKLAEKQAQLSEDFPDYAELASPKPLLLADTQALLAKHQALVLFLDIPEWGNIPEETIVFALTKKMARWVSIPLDTKALRQRVAALRCGLDNTSWRFGQESREMCKKMLAIEVSEDSVPPFDAAAAYTLYRDLFGDIEDIMKGKELLIVPSGALTQLPFEVLVTEKPDESLPRFGAYKKAVWLGQRQAITIMPSVASLKALKTAKTSTAPEPYVGFGNPLLDGHERNDRTAWEKQSCGGLPAAKTVRVASRAPAVTLVVRGGRGGCRGAAPSGPLARDCD